MDNNTGWSNAGQPVYPRLGGRSFALTRLEERPTFAGAVAPKGRIWREELMS